MACTMLFCVLELLNYNNIIATMLYFIHTMYRRLINCIYFVVARATVPKV